MILKKKSLMKSLYCAHFNTPGKIYVSDRQEIEIEIDRKRVDGDGKTGET